MSAPAALRKPMHSVLNLSVPVVLYFDSAGGGGTAVYALNFASTLRQKGYRVAVICSDASALADTRKRLMELDITVHTLPDETKGVRARLRRLGWFLAILRQYRGGVLALLLGSYTNGGPVILAGAVAGMAAIIRADLQPPMPPFPGALHRLLLNLTDRLVDRIVVGAAENRDSFVRNTGRTASSIAVIHTGIDLAQYVPGVGRTDGRADLGIEADTLVVGTVARLEEERKGVASFIQMAAAVSSNYPGAVFVIVGDGPLRVELETLASRLNVRAQTIFAGWQSDTVRVLSAMDVLVMSSLFEGGPTIVLEAMAMAKPVVATRVGMVPEVILPDSNGLIVEPGDAVGLANAVSRLLTDDRLRSRLGQAARDHALQYFSRETMVDQYLHLFAAALHPNHHRAG